MQELTSSFMSLPADALFEILGKLTISEVTRLASVNKDLSEFINRSHYWEDKCKQHFPHHYINGYHNPIHEVIKKLINTNWYTLFIQFYYTDYFPIASTYGRKINITARDRSNFTNVKENDLERLREAKITLEDLHKKDCEYISLFAWALRKNDTDVMTYLLEVVKNEFAEDCKKIDSKGWSALYWACLFGNIQWAEELCQKGVSAFTYERVQKMEDTPLIAACRNRNYELVKLLLQHGKDEENKDYFINSALGEIDSPKNEKLLMLLVDNITPTSIETYWFRFRQTCEKGNMILVRALVAKNRNFIDYRPEETNQSTLASTCEQGQLECAQFLIEQGANINCFAEEPHWSYCNSPLYLAVKKNHADIVNLLCEKHASLQNEKEYNILKEAILEQDKDSFELLVKLGANSNWVSSSGETLLHFACEYKKFKMIKILCEEYKLDVNAKDNQGNTPLHLTRTSSEIINYLIEQRADINAKNFEENTPLHLCCDYYFYKNRGKDALELLINSNTDITVENKKHQTPLAKAAANSTLTLAQFKKLVETGSRIATSLEVAIEKIDLSEIKDSKRKCILYINKLREFKSKREKDPREYQSGFARFFKIQYCSRTAELNAVDNLIKYLENHFEDPNLDSLIAKLRTNSIPKELDEHHESLCQGELGKQLRTMK